jgi:hypothetical protein
MWKQGKQSEYQVGNIFKTYIFWMEDLIVNGEEQVYLALIPGLGGPQIYYYLI